MDAMTSPSTDPRAVATYKIPATSLRAGDLLNTSPGGEDDWQQVLSVHTAENPGTDSETTTLLGEIGDRYVLVRLSDVAPVDAPVYFSNGAAFAYGDDGADVEIAEVVSEPGAARSFLYTRHELVTVRS
jgi:hypothetical protein